MLPRPPLISAEAEAKSAACDTYARLWDRKATRGRLRFEQQTSEYSWSLSSVVQR